MRIIAWLLVASFLVLGSIPTHAQLVLEYLPGTPVTDTDFVIGGIADIEYLTTVVDPEPNPIPTMGGPMVISTFAAIPPGAPIEFSLTTVDPEVDFLGPVTPDPLGIGFAAGMAGFAAGPGAIVCPFPGCFNSLGVPIPAGTPLVAFDLVEAAGVGLGADDDLADITLASILGVIDPIAGSPAAGPFSYDAQAAAVPVELMLFEIE